MKKRIIFIIIIILMSISFITGILLTNDVYRTYYNDKIVESNKTSTISNSSSIAMMLETEADSGEYYLSTDTSWPDSSIYTFNETLSKCENGGTLEWDSDNEQILMTGTKSDRCYIYFDYDATLTKAYAKYGTLDNIVSNDIITSITGIWDSGLTNDGYRYVGETPNNYICFGTTDMDTCTSNTDLYMYRIVGVFADSSGDYHLKLIKKEVIDTTHYWYPSNANVNWTSSPIYTGINGSSFLTSSTYSYMQNTSWSNLIETWTWTAANTLTYSGSGITYNGGETAGVVYYHETNQTELISSCNTGTCTVGSWTTASAKIGIMYVSDYALSFGNISKINSYDTSSWMLIINNDDISISEPTMARYGVAENGSYYYIWRVLPEGNLAVGSINGTYYIRPVFYLTSSVTINEGNGTQNSPYMISLS